MKRGISTAVGSALLLIGCSDPAPDPLAMAPEQRRYDPAQLARGEQLYNQHCASCHGPSAAGAPNWRQRNADGRYPPPPLNGTAHAWHHPLAQLRQTIKHGGPRGSQMPAWDRTLSDAQIDDIIAWFQSLWPAEIYTAWYGGEMRSRE